MPNARHAVHENRRNAIIGQMLLTSAAHYA